jgi:hypothetical protein
MESLPVSRASLVEAYIDALPFAAVAIGQWSAPAR